jgi:hypothetical protein
LGIGPNPQSPIPNPQSPLEKISIHKNNYFKMNKNNKILFISNLKKWEQ